VVSVNWRGPDVSAALSRTNIGLYAQDAEVQRQLEERDRLAELATYAPAVTTAAQLLGMFNQPSIPLHPKSLTVMHDRPLATVEAICDWYAERPRDHLGVMTGAGLVGVAISTVGGWQDWLLSVAGTATEYLDGDDRVQVRKDVRPYGVPGAVLWQAPTHHQTAWTSPVLQGREVNQAGQVLGQRLASRDQGGWLIFRVGPDDRGRMARFPGKRLSSEVHVLADRSAVPVWSSAPGGWVLTLVGWPEQTEEAAAPPWFIEHLGGRW
jgi:hypothetical protein